MKNIAQQKRKKLTVRSLKEKHLRPKEKYTGSSPVGRSIKYVVDDIIDVFTSIV